MAHEVKFKERVLEYLSEGQIQREIAADLPLYNVYRFRVRKDDKITLKGSVQKWGKQITVQNR